VLLFPEATVYVALSGFDSGVLALEMNKILMLSVEFVKADPSKTTLTPERNAEPDYLEFYH
jgi:hypothetical protein